MIQSQLLPIGRSITRQKTWHQYTVDSWIEFINLIWDIEQRYEREKHHFFYRGQGNEKWGLVSTIVRELNNKKTGDLSLERAFQIERDARKEFASQVHLHMNPPAIPDLRNPECDWLEWWALMQHYGAPTRLLDWTASPYVAAYFAVRSDDQADGVIWILNDWALGDRMMEEHPDDWHRRWDLSYRSSNDWCEVAGSFKGERFFDETAAPQIFFFQPNTKSPRVVAQQGWLSTSLSLATDYETLIADLFSKHRDDPNHKSTYNTEPWKNWNCNIVIPKEQKREFLRQLQVMNITANTLFPGVDGLGRSIVEFVQIEVQHDRPGSSHPLP